jgi:hypothetical protein
MTKVKYKSNKESFKVSVKNPQNSKKTKKHKPNITTDFKFKFFKRQI